MNICYKMFNRWLLLLVCALILSVVNSVSAEENTLHLSETIQGNQEQPTVLYIVPWQAVEAPPARYAPIENLVKENYQLIDRDAFRRLHVDIKKSNPTAAKH